MTGPQGVLPAFGGHQDNPELGEVTGTWVAAIQADHDRIAGRIATELVAEQGGKAPAPGHARRRGGRSWFRRILPGPAAGASPPQRYTDEPTMGYVAVGNLEHGAVHGGWSSPAAGVAHGAQAADPAATAGPAGLDAAPELQQSTPPAAVSWEEWDTPENREPMVPAYVPDIPADLTENPGFREALRMHTRDSARQCRCGCRVDGDTWGERMVRSAIHVLRSDTAAVAFVPWPGEAPPDATEAGIEAYDARHPVPAALAGGAA